MRLKTKSNDIIKDLTLENIEFEDSDFLPSVEEAKDLFSENVKFKMGKQDYKVYDNEDVYGYDVRGLDVDIVTLDDLLDFCREKDITEVEMLVTNEDLEDNLMPDYNEDLCIAWNKLINSLSDKLNRFGSYTFMVEYEGKLLLARIIKRIAYEIALAIDIDITDEKEMLEATDIWGEEKETFVDGLWSLPEIVLQQYREDELLDEEDELLDEEDE